MAPKIVGGCCGFISLALLPPISVLIAVMLETPLVTQVTAAALADYAKSRGASPEYTADATEAPKQSPSGPRMGSGNMFDRIAFVYDSTNKWMSLGLDQHWRRSLVQDCLKLEKDDRVLDLATGTADVGLLVGEKLQELASGKAPVDSVLGVDPSSEMLRRGVSKVETKGLKGVVRLVKGDAQDLSQVQGIDAAGTLSSPTAGLADDSIDKISMSFGIRNVPKRVKALEEMGRVLRKRPQSRVCILEFSLPGDQTPLSRVARAFITHVVPFIGRVATMGSGSEEYEYLERSILRFPQPLGFAAEMQKAGLAVKTITSFAFGAVNLYEAEPQGTA